mgnify:CR=1 FL=1
MSEEQDKRRQTEAQVEAIETEIRENHPLCADKAGIAALKKRYENGSNFSKGVEYLESCYNGMRCVRGDGNCYYRAFLYSLCEHLKKDPEELNRVSELGESNGAEIVGLTRFERIFFGGFFIYVSTQFHCSYPTLMLFSTTFSNEIHG